jgi:hypothetical protein
MRFLIIAAVSLIGMAAMAYFLRIPLRDDIIRQVLRIAEEQGVRVDYDAVWGDLFGGINLSNLSVIQDEDHSFYADQVRLSYRLIPYLLEKRIDIRSVRLIRPHVRWVLPLEKEEEREPLDPGFSLDLTSFHIRSGYLELADTLMVEGIQLDISLHVRPHHINGRLRRASALLRLNGEERLRLRSAKTNFAYAAPDTVHLDDLFLLTQRSKLRGEIHLLGPSWDVGFEEASIDLSEIDPQTLEGRLAAQGRVGEDSTGFGGGFTLDIEGARVGEFSLADVNMALGGEGGNFEISLSASDPSLGRITSAGTMRLKREGVSVDLAIEEVELFPAPGWPVSFKGKVTAGYSLQEKEGEIRGTLEEIGIHTMRWEHCRFDAAFAGETIRLREFLLTQGFTRIQAEGVFSPDTITSSVGIQSFQMASLGELNPLGAPAEVDAELEVEGDKGAPKISGIVLVRSDEAFFERIEANLASFDPLNFAGTATLDVGGVTGVVKEKIDLKATIEDGFLEAAASAGPDMSLTTKGLITLDWERNIYEYGCEELILVISADTIENRFPFVLGKAADSIYLSPTFLFVGAGELATTGSWRPGKLPRWELSLYDIELATLGRIFNLPANSSGLIWGQIASRGETEDRTIHLDLGAADLRVGDMEADSLSFTGVLDTSKLEFDAAFVLAQGRSTAKGYLCYDLKDSIPIQSFDLEAHLDNIGVWPFEFLKDILEVRTGEVKGELHASGTLEEPDLKGWVNIRNAELYVPVIDLTSERADADVLFDNGRAIIDRLDADVGAGSIQGRGDYTIFTEPYPFFFGFRVKDVVFSPERHISAVCSGNLTLEGTYITPLMIDGKIDLKEALFTYRLGEEIRVISPVAPLPDPSLPPPPPVYVNLDIRGEKNIWIRNNDMDIEVIPDLEIILRDDPMPQIIGELRVKRGSAYYLDHQFRLDPARSRIVFPPTEELDPEFDIWASKLTNEIDSSRGSPEVIKITLHMAGTLTEPILEFYSDPPVWSESEIISYLHLNLATAFIQGVVRDVTSPIQNWARLDVFSIEDFAMQDVPTKVTFGKYISDKLFASYTLALSQRKPGENQHQFRVEYDVGKNQDIILERDEEGAHNLRYQIKLRY